MIQDLSTATPVEIDTEFARLQNEQSDIERSEVAFKRIIEDPYATEAEVDEAQRRLLVTNESWRKLADEIVSLNAEYIRRGGWNRYYMVDNTNGHLHTTTACRNTYRTTQWYWMVELSGQERWDAVQAAGSLACLTCFSEYREFIELARPGTIETPNQRKTREQREADAQAKAEKAAKAAAKAITNPDGTPLEIPEDYDTYYPRLVKTEIAAQRAASQAAFQLAWYGVTHPSANRWREQLKLCVNALAAKRGVDDAALLDEILVKARKKVRKDGGDPQH